MKKNICFGLVALFAAASILWFMAPQSSAQEKVYNLRYANFFPVTHRNSQVSEAWCKEVEKRTNGRVKIAYFAGGTLTPPAQTYDSVTTGITDIGMSVFNYTRGKFPMMDAINQPMGYKSAYLVTKLANEFYRKFRPKELDEVKVMYLHGHGPGIMHTKKPVTKLEDVKGMKIRASGSITRIVYALGGSPVGTTMPETYDALRTGVADGAMAPYEALSGFKWGEVINSTTECYTIAYTDTEFVVMNKDKWNALPQDIQKTIEKINEEWIEKQGRAWDEIDKEGKEFVLKRGNKIQTLSAQEGARWKAKVEPLIEDYIKTAKAKGLPGEGAIKFVKDYMKANQK